MQSTAEVQELEVHTFNLWPYVSSMMLLHIQSLVELLLSCDNS